MTTEVAAAEGAEVQVSDADRPYPPSWVDVITSAIDRLPGPTWLAYIVLLLVACLIASTEGWIAGISTFPAIDLAQASYGLFFIAPLAVIHYLDGVAGDAWDQFRPATLRFTCSCAPSLRDSSRPSCSCSRITPCDSCA